MSEGGRGVRAVAATAAMQRSKESEPDRVPPSSGRVPLLPSDSPPHFMTVPTRPELRDLPAELARRVGERRFDMWFGDSTRFEVRDGTLEVIAPSPYAADWIGRHFRDALRGVARESLGLGEDARVEIRSASPAAAPTELPRTTRGMLGDEPRTVEARLADADLPGGRPARRPVPATARWRDLSEFVVGPSNRLAFDSARRLGDAESEQERMLFLHGDCGVGKTHLLQGACRRRRDRFPGQRIRYTTGEQFTNEFIGAVRGGSVEAFRRRFRGVDLLAIDDVHFLSNKTATQAEFLHTLDAIALGGARVVLASDEHPRQIARFSRSLVSRFLAGMVVRIESPDRETRRLLLHRLAAGRGLELAPSAEEAIVGRFAGSARELEGAVAKLAAMRSIDGSADPAIGMVLVDRMLRDEDSSPRAPVRFARIVEVVAERLGVERGEILGHSKLKRTSEARGVVVHLARRLTTLSYPEIARAFGRRNHSSLHGAETRIRESLDRPGDESLERRELIDRLAHEILRGE